jgi:DNA-binding HxlR family transcriptional regulator
MGKSDDNNNPLNCPVTRTVKYIGGRWKPIILFLLLDKTRRFGQLSAFVPTISRKILTQQLKELEADGFIERKQYKEIPPRVEYKSSEIGKSLIPIMNTMCDWGKSMGIELEGTK